MEFYNKKARVTNQIALLYFIERLLFCLLVIMLFMWVTI